MPLTDLGNGAVGTTFQYLFPGEYTVSFQAPVGIASFETVPVVPATVIVVAGQATPASFLLSGAMASEL
jgi:hypothetical protein